MNTLYIVCGSPASGKTTYGKNLAANKHAVFLSIDTATEEIIRAALRASDRDPEDRDSDYFKSTYRQPIYDCLLAIAHENLSVIDVVLEAPFTREIRNPGWPEELAQKINCKAEIHYLYCNPEERRRRMTERGMKRDRAKLDNWENYLKYYGEEAPPACRHIAIDTSEKDNRD